MTAGRERGVMLWDAHECLLQRRLEAINQELERLALIEEPPTRKRRDRVSDLEGERQRIMLSLAQLGPSPRAKMG